MLGRQSIYAARAFLVQVAGHHDVGKGLELEVSMEWPILLNGAIPLQLKGVGRVVRSDTFTFAVSLSKTDFQTQKKGPRISG